jgi:hypothetical protein
MSERYLTVKTLAHSDLCPFCEETIRRAIRAGQLAAVRRRRGTFIGEEDAADWILRGAPTKPESGAVSSV